MSYVGFYQLKQLRTGNFICHRSLSSVLLFMKPCYCERRENWHWCHIPKRIRPFIWRQIFLRVLLKCWHIIQKICSYFDKEGKYARSLGEYRCKMVVRSRINLKAAKLHLVVSGFCHPGYLFEMVHYVI